jgi:GNAT superfamily N-acetyltransferase
MQFELTEALIDDILFSMEDQNGEFCMDTQDGTVAEGPDIELYDAAEEEEDSRRYIALPEWDSSEGFRLMERFAAGFRNPPIRDKLTAALDRGKGVFRAFKDVLSDHPEAEQLWFAFKRREMRRVIVNWYNSLREEWGLERIGVEPEDTDDLVLEDFRFRDGGPEDGETVEALHRQCLQERIRDAAGPQTEGGNIPAAGTEGWVFPGNAALVAETGGGEFAGYISVCFADGAARIAALEVRPEYRGLGLGEALLVRILAKIDPRDTRGVLIELPAGARGFSRVLIRESFRPLSTRYWLPAEFSPKSG